MPRTFPRLPGRIAIVALLALCQCSFLYDLSAFDVGGPDDGGDGSRNDGQVLTLDAPDDSLALDGGADVMPGPGGADATLLDALPNGPIDTGLDSGPDASGASPDSGLITESGSSESSSADAEAGANAESDATSDSGGGGKSSLDAGSDATDGGPNSGDDDTGTDASPVVPANDAGLVAYYQFSESTGTTSADDSGNNETATMVGATFSTGVQGNAATMSGSSQYVSLPAGIVSGLTSFSVSTWVYLSVMPPQHVHIFDFGTGTTDYMFLTPHNGGGVLQFAISTSSTAGEQSLDSSSVLALTTWQQVCVTLSGTTGILYVNGVEVVRNTAMTLNPSSLRTTTQDWIGRSQFPTDPYLTGKVDQFRIYNRALSAAEVLALFQAQD